LDVLLAVLELWAKWGERSGLRSDQNMVRKAGAATASSV